MFDPQQLPQELDALVEITEILTGKLPFLEKCESVLAVLAMFTGSELVILREWDSENSTLDLVVSYNHLVPPEDLRPRIPVRAGLASEALST